LLKNKNKLKRLALPVANAVFIILSLVYLVSVFNQPYMGLAVEKNEGNWTVIYSDPHGEGTRLGIRQGDIVMQINGMSPEACSSVQRWGEVEGVSTLVIKSSGMVEPQVIQVTVHPYIRTLTSELPLIVVGLCFWLFGLYAVVKRPLLRQAQALFWLNWLIGLLFIMVPASSRGLFLAKELMFIGFSLAPLLLLNFIAVLLKLEKQRPIRILLWLLGVLPLLITITIVLKWLGLVYAVNKLRTMTLVSGLIGFLAAGHILFGLLRYLGARPEKNRMSMLLVGLIGSLFPFIILTGIPITLGIDPILYPRFTALFIVFLPVTMTYVVINQYLPDARKMLKGILIYLITGIVTSLFLYYLLNASGWIPLRDIDIYLSLLTLTTATIIFLHVLKFLENKITHRLSDGQQNQENLTDRKEALPPDDEKTILEDLVRRCELEGAMVVVEEGDSYYTQAVGRYEENLREKKELEEHYQRISNTASTQIFPRTFPAEFYFPFVCQSYKCGLFLGYRRSHITMSVQEVPFIRIIAYQACQRLKAVYMMKSLTQRVSGTQRRLEEMQREHRVVTLFKRWLFNNVEEEKKGLAREIHDGPLQICLYLTRKIKTLKEESGESAEISFLPEIQELMEELNYELRTICTNLRPAILKDLGLILALETLIEEIMRKELITITLEVRGASWDQRLEEETEVAIYRLIQEGIRNVIKHTDSNQAEIVLTQTDQEIQVRIQDYGKGFDTAIIQADLIEELLADSHHFGIIGIKERIESLGGQFSVASISGQGTVVQAILPNRKVR